MIRSLLRRVGGPTIAFAIVAAAFMAPAHADTPTSSANPKPDFATTQAGTSVIIKPFANDEIVYETRFKPVIVTAPLNGTFNWVYTDMPGAPTPVPDLQTSYTPDDGFSGVDTFVYRIEVDALYYGPITVTIEVTPLPFVDTDGDGISDANDNCPDTPAGTPVDANGCAIVVPPTDSDNDGVTDANDNCPNTPTGTPVDVNGCAIVVPPVDSDNDGVTDANDQCAATPAGQTVDVNGCSASQRDSDNDGVMDDKDNCANTPTGTPVDVNGCAIVPEDTDTDGDGVPDYRDKCPGSEPGAEVNNQGCTVVVPPKECVNTLDSSNVQVGYVGANAFQAKVKYTGNKPICNNVTATVSMNSYGTDGPTWPTSGTQVFVDHRSVTISVDVTEGTLNVAQPPCTSSTVNYQTDVFWGSTRYDGKDGALPHYPDSVTPLHLIDHRNGSFECVVPPKELTATAPTRVDKCGVENDTYTISPTKDGIIQKANGVVKAPGTYPGVGTVTITSEAPEGSVLKGTHEWTLVFTNVACDEEVQPPVETPTTTPPTVQQPVVLPVETPASAAPVTPGVLTVVTPVAAKQLASTGAAPDNQLGWGVLLLVIGGALLLAGVGRRSKSL